jgi:hypothetical protein
MGNKNLKPKVIKNNTIEEKKETLNDFNKENSEKQKSYFLNLN